MKRKFFAIIVSLLISAPCAPEAATLGEWKVWQSYSYYTDMQRVGNKLYTLSVNHLFVADIEGDSILARSVTRLDGLSGTEIFSIHACDELSALAIVYADGNIDVIDEDGSVSNIPDLANKVIYGDRTLNRTQVQDHRLFISLGFGFVCVNLLDKAFDYSCSVATGILEAFEYGGYIWYSTTSGLFRCALTDNIYVRDNWKQVSSAVLSQAIVFPYGENTQAWFSTTDKRLYRFSSAGEFEAYDNRQTYTSLYHVGNYIFASGNGIQLINLSDLSRAVAMSEPVTIGQNFTQLNDTVFYMVHLTDGIYRLSAPEISASGSATFRCDDTPLAFSELGAARMGNLTWEDGMLTAVTGGLMSGGYYAIANQTGVLSTLDSDADSWENITQKTIDSQLTSRSLGGSFRGLTSFARNAEGDTAYVGSLNYGVYVLAGDSVAHRLDYKNSPLPEFSGASITRCTALCRDSYGNLWFGCAGTSWPLTCLSAAGEWHRFQAFNGNTGESIQRIIRAEKDPYHIVWTISNFPYNGCRVGMVYDALTTSDTSDDAIASFSSLTDQDGNTLYPYYYNDICEDRNGAIWLLTSSGPFVIDSQIDGFNNPGSVRRPKIPRNDGTNLADWLMAGINTTCIVVDAANRKWIGTSDNGLYLLSEDGLTQIEHFTTLNSPLPSDNILALAYDEATGTLYISSDGGICSYVTDGVAGASDYSHAYCYPNPLRPEFSGQVHIMGLMDNTVVRITDIRNHVLFTTRSSGGMVTWDGCGPSGSRVPSGVYFVWGIDADGKEGCVTKLLVIE